MLNNKNGIIFGVANKRSIAWATALALHEAGANLAFTYQGERLKENVEELTKEAMPGSLLLSCDRAALLVTQDANVIGRTMMKLSGGTFASRVDYDQFLGQARDFQKNYDEKALDRFWADVITSGMSHPFPVWRVSEILQWVESGEYKALMNAPESAAA